ncbi:MAG: hypothetical protein ACYDA1_03960 [Vulcanimicrobiaceae bacterium]
MASSILIRRISGLVLAVLVVGCSHVNVDAPNIKGIGYVDVAQAATHDPMYSQVRALDESLSALNFAARTTAHLTPAQIEDQIKKLNAQLTAAQAQTQKYISGKQSQYLHEESVAIGQALAAAGVPNAAAIANSLAASASGKQQAAYTQAGQDLQAYRNDVVAQDSATMRATMDQLQKEISSKLQAKSEELAQRESSLSLKQSSDDAGERLALQTRMANLALDDASRKDIQAKLKAIDVRENANLAALRKADSQEFDSYRKTLLSTMNQRMARESAAMQQATAAKLQSRQTQVVANLKNMAPATLPANLSDATKQSLASIQSQFSDKFNADAQAAMDAFNKTKNDIQVEYAALKSGGDLASADAAKQLLTVQQQRQDVYAKIVARVTQTAQKIAQDRGLRVVIADPSATPGGYDLTPDVTKAIESLHE